MANRFWVGGAATWDGTTTTHWAATSNGAGGQTVPTAADDVFFDGNSGTGNVAIGGTGTRVCKSITCTGYTGTISGSVALSIGTTSGGGLLLVAGMTWSYTGTLSFISTSTHTLTSGGKTLNNLTINGTGLVVNLGDDLTVSGQITHTAGTFNLNAHNCTVATLNTSGSTTRVLTLGSGNLTCTATGTSFTAATATGLTLNANTSSVIISGNGATMSTGGKTFNNVKFSGTGPTLTTNCTISGTLEIASASGTITLPSGATVGTLKFSAAGTFAYNGIAFTTIDFTGFTGTLSGSTAMTVAGSLTLVSGMTFTYSGTITFTATATGKTITTAGKTMPSVTFNGVGGGWQMQDNWAGSTSTITLTAGTLDTNGKSITCGTFNASGSTTRTLTLGASVITISSSFSMSTVTGLTLTSNTSTIALGASASMSGNVGKPLYNITYTNQSSLSLTSTYLTNNLVLNYSGTTQQQSIPDMTSTGAANISIVITTSSSCELELTGSLSCSGNLSITSTAGRSSVIMTGFGGPNLVDVGGNLTMTGVASGRLIFGTAEPAGGSCELDVDGTITVNNTIFVGVYAGGSGSWNLSASVVGNGGGNNNITFTAPITCYWFKDTGNMTDVTKWFAATNGGGGAVRAPLPQDIARFDANSFSAGSKTVTANLTINGDGSHQVQWMPGMDWTGALNSPTLASSQVYNIVNANITFISAMTIPIVFWIIGWSNGVGTPTDTITLTTAGQGLSIIQAAANLVLGDDISGSAQVIGYQSVVTNNHNITAGGFFVGIGGNLGTSIILCGACSLNPTVSAASATIILDPNGVGADTTFDIEGATVGTVKFLSDATFGNALYDGGLVGGTIGTLVLDATTHSADCHLTIGNGLTFNITTMTSLTNATYKAVLVSDSPGAPYIFSKASGFISIDYVSLTDSTAQGGATFYAGANSIDNGGNTGWNFTAAVTNYILSVVVGTFALSGQNAGTLVGRKIQAATGAFALTGVNDNLLYGRKVSAAVGNFALTGVNSILKAGRTLASGTGSFALTGVNDNLLVGRKVSASTGAFNLVGQNDNLIYDRIFPAGAGSFDFEGIDVGLRRGFNFATAVGNFNLTGQDNNFIYDRVFAAGTGEFNLDGEDAKLEHGRLFSVGTGAFTVTGVDDILFYDRVIKPAAGAFALSGHGAGLLAARKIAAGPGAFSLSGISAGLLVGRKLSCSTAAYLLTGQNINMRATRVIKPAAGSFALSGEAALLRRGLILAAQRGQFVLVGDDINTPRTYTIKPQAGLFTLAGQDASVLFKRYMRAPAGDFELSGYDAELIYRRALHLFAESAEFMLDGIDADLSRTFSATTTADVYIYF